MPAAAPPPRDPAERFAGIIIGLRRALAAVTLQQWGRPARLAGPLAILIWARISRIADRFARLANRIQQGRLPQPRKPAAPRQAEERPPRPPPDPAAPKLPRGRTWLIRLAGSEVAAGASQLRSLLADPEMQALIGQAPEAMSRTLRPLCWMLGVEVPPGLLPPRKRRKRVKPPKPPRPAPEPEPLPKPRPRGLCEPPGRYAPGAWIDRVPPHWRDVLEGTVAPRGRRKRKLT